MSGIHHIQSAHLLRSANLEFNSPNAIAAACDSCTNPTNAAVSPCRSMTLICSARDYRACASVFAGNGNSRVDGQTRHRVELHGTFRTPLPATIQRHEEANLSTGRAIDEKCDLSRRFASAEDSEPPRAEGAPARSNPDGGLRRLITRLWRWSPARRPELPTIEWLLRADQSTAFPQNPTEGVISFLRPCHCGL